jgi:hypothetical protein
MSQALLDAIEEKAASLNVMISRMRIEIGKISGRAAKLQTELDAAIVERDQLNADSLRIRNPQAR